MQTLTTPIIPAINLSKLTSSIILAAIITFALFVAMHKLIANDDLVRLAPKPGPMIDLWQKIEDAPIINKPKKQPLQKLIPKPLPIPQLKETNTEMDLDPGLYASNFKGPVIKTDIKPNFDIEDGVARPIVRVEPKYPAIAARDGLEGWVKLSFSITPSGTVDNIQVIDAEPQRVFNQAARRALAKWKYKPNIQAGKAQAQDGMMVMLDFKLAS